MKKARNSKRDEMRAEYKRSDFKKLERGKFYQRVVAGSNVVVLTRNERKRYEKEQKLDFQSAILCGNG